MIEKHMQKGFVQDAITQSIMVEKRKTKRRKKRNFIRDGQGILTSSGGSEFIVDLDTFEWAKDILWTDSGCGYATMGKGNMNIYLHRMIMPDLHIVDHINRNTFDNRKCNLRDGGNGVNMLNKKARKTSKSGFRGIYQMGRKWQIRIGGANNRTYLGTYGSIDEARKVLSEYAVKNGLSEFYNC